MKRQEYLRQCSIFETIYVIFFSIMMADFSGRIFKLVQNQTLCHVSAIYPILIDYYLRFCDLYIISAILM